MARHEQFSVGNLTVNTINGSPYPSLPGMGNIYFVVGSGSSSYDDMCLRYGGLYYEDGSAVLYKHVSSASAVTTDGLATAVSKMVEDRNDYVIVMPANSTYYIDAALALDKKSMHLVCPAGLGYDIGATNAARIQQITAATACFAVSDASVEVAGFYIKQYADVAAITLAATSYAPNIHHNTFPLIWSSSPVASIVGTGDAGAWGKIERNWFVSQAGGAVTAAIAAIDIKANATAAQCNHNMVTIGDTNIATVGISNAAVKGNTNFNIFSECGGNGVSDGGTITNCISIHASGCAIGNRCAVASGEFATGGTAAHSFCDNLDGRSTSGTDIWNLEA